MFFNKKKLKQNLWNPNFVFVFIFLKNNLNYVDFRLTVIPENCCLSV